jgi:hypothetical protein
MLARWEHSEDFYVPSEEQTDKETALDWICEICPPSASNAGFLRIPHTKEVGTASSLLRIRSHDLYALLRIINSTVILGDSRTAWDSVAGSAVRFQVVTLKKY